MALFKQMIALFNGTSPIVSAAFIPDPNDLFFNFGVDGATGTGTITQSSTNGAMTQITTLGGSGNYNDGSSDTWSLWYRSGAAGSSSTVTVTSGVHSCAGLGADYRGVSAIGTVSVNKLTSPGTGAGSVTGTGAVVPAGSIMFAFAVGVSSSQNGGTLAAVATFNPSTRYNSVMIGTAPALLADYPGTGVSITPTFTPSIGVGTYLVFQGILTPVVGIIESTNRGVNRGRNRGIA